MAAVILGWDESQWGRWNYRAVVEQVLQTGRYLDHWGVGADSSLQPGTDVWLLFRDGTRSGLIGHGVALTETFAAEHHPGAGIARRGAAIAFDAVLPLGEHIALDALAAAVTGVDWAGALTGDVITVPPAAEPDLRRAWLELGPAAGGPTELVPGTYPRDAVSSIEVNRYERDPDARRVCLAFHGTACAACGFSFEVSYGEVGEGYIQVHHTVPASQLGDGYQLDPVADLVPLCANCHAMAHLGVSTPRTVQELRSVLVAAGHLRGQAVSAGELEAQADARRLLERRHD